jgi:hypothetical protein
MAANERRSTLMTLAEKRTLLIAFTGVNQRPMVECRAFPKEPNADSFFGLK